MKLAREFIRLPLRFDAERLAEEVQAFPRKAWQAHPLRYKGNSAGPLISVDGGANDFFAGQMAESQWLQQSPYLRQVLASFQVVFGRSRLMGLGGGNEVPMHCDINYHWFTRIRIHVPIITFPEVDFHCHDQVVNMAAGEAWIFDNWKLHKVINGNSQQRIHLLADTVGSSTFWAWAGQALKAAEAGETLDTIEVPYQADSNPLLQMERFNTPDVMHPCEMELLTEDLIEDLMSSGDRNEPELVDHFINSVRAFCQDWKALWTLHADSKDGWEAYEALRNQQFKDLIAMRQPLLIASNQRMAQKVMLSRVLVASVHKAMPGMNELQFAK